MRVLVLDGNQRAALAATRSLGRAGFTVLTADRRRRTLAGSSRYSRSELVYPIPSAAPDDFLEWVEQAIPANDLDAVLPITEVTTDLLVRHRDRWPMLELPFATIEKIDALSDKVELYQRALKLGVPVPRSVVVRCAEDVERGVAEIGFPAVLKPPRSWLRKGSRFVPTRVRIVRNRDELAAALATDDLTDVPFLYQEHIDGGGNGVFALYWHGRAAAFFSHRRLREKPVDGGVSVLCESRPPDPPVLAAAKRLLDDADWHGVAMVEFKGAGASARLMEVNARFWGSLQLAVDAGINFPALLFQRRSSGGDAACARYRYGRRLRWFLGDVDRMYMLVRDVERYGLRRVGRELLGFASPRPFTTRHETFRWRDPLPALNELFDYIRALRGVDDLS